MSSTKIKKVEKNLRDFSIDFFVGLTSFLFRSVQDKEEAGSTL